MNDEEVQCYEKHKCVEIEQEVTNACEIRLFQQRNDKSICQTKETITEEQKYEEDKRLPA